jgi:hypothetical protein
MAGVAVVDVADTLELFTDVAVVIATTLLFVALNAGQWSDQSASHALVTEELTAEEGTVQYFRDPVEVPFEYGTRHPWWLEFGNIALAVMVGGAFVVLRTADWECKTEL